MVIFCSGDAEKREFQAETRMLLDIVAKSLYSESEVRNQCFEYIHVWHLLLVVTYIQYYDIIILLTNL